MHSINLVLVILNKNAKENANKQKRFVSYFNGNFGKVCRTNGNLHYGPFINYRLQRINMVEKWNCQDRLVNISNI
jgi:hypothetical protein